MLNKKIKGDTVPVIDISSLFSNKKSETDNLARSIAAACNSIGFFYIINHGVSHTIFDNVFSECRALFNMSAQEKELINIHKSKHMRGYFSFGADKSDGIHGDIKEGFDMASDIPLDDPYVKAGLAFYGPNVWPANLPNFKRVTTEYYTSMLQVGRLLLRSFARGLGVEDNFFDDKFRKPMAQMRLLRYPQTPNPNSKQIGAGEHTDFGWITMIAQDEIGGLEVLNKQGEWIDIPPVPSSLVVNIGDLMARWTNDQYTATFHRVINKSSRDRYSIAFFMDPDYHANVECLPSCKSKNRPAKYDPIIAGDYMNKRFYETTTFRDYQK